MKETICKLSAEETDDVCGGMRNLNEFQINKPPVLVFYDDGVSIWTDKLGCSNVYPNYS